MKIVTVTSWWICIQFRCLGAHSVGNWSANRVEPYVFASRSFCYCGTWKIWKSPTRAKCYTSAAICPGTPTKKKTDRLFLSWKAFLET